MASKPLSSDDLALFEQVARRGSFSRAALETGTNQSTVSRHIAELETRLGVRLFRRSGRGVVLTDRGHELAQYAQSVARTLESASAAMRLGADHGPARLRIAAQPTIARVMFGSLALALRHQFPQTALRLVEGLASQVLVQLQDGEVDLAVLYRPEHAGALKYDPLLHEGMHLVAPPGYPLKGKAFPVARLGEVPLIVPSTHHGIRVLLESLATRYGFEPRVVLECDASIALTKQLVMEGCGCTVLPLAAVAEEVAAGKLLSRPLAQPDVSRSVGIVFGRVADATSGVWEAAQAIKRIVVDLDRQGAWPGTTLDPALGSSG